MRPMKLTTIAFSMIGLSFALAQLIDGKPTSPTGYEIELAEIHKQIGRLNDGMSRAPSEEAIRTPYLLYRRAALTGGVEDFMIAEAAIDEGIRRFGPSDDFYLLKANLDLKLHRLPGVKRALAMLPSRASNAQVRTMKADIAFQEGRYDDARKAYESVIEGSRAWDRLARLAYLKSKTGDPLGADRLYEQAEEELSAKEMRSYAWIELQRGLLELNRGRYENARAHYERANRAYSGYWLVDEYRAELFGAEGKFAEAAALYRGVIVQAPHPEFLQELADLYSFAGKSEEATLWYEKALAAYLESARRGEVHYYHHLASFYADVRQDGAEAIQWARKDLELRRNYSTWEAFAWALYRDGKFAEALDAINQALCCGIEDAHLYFHAAMIHLAAGRTSEGKRLLIRAGEINPRFENFHVHR